MSKLMLIDAAHPEETRVTVVADGQIEDFDFEARDKRQLRGNIYLAKVTRVEPSLQAAFVEYGGNRHGFLAFSEIHPDYYQIPAEDRAALIAEQMGPIRDDDDDDDDVIEHEHEEDTAHKEVDASEDSSDAVEEDAASDDDAEDQSLVDTDSDEETASSDADSEGDDTDTADEAPARARKPARAVKRYKIQEVIKRRQVMLIQVVKEERGNKGAAVTTYLSLAGRYGVLMPNTARGGGISRKITNASDRKRLKKIMGEFDVPEGMGLIIRTAGAKRTKSEISRDYEYLMRLWSNIRNQTLESIAPCLIHEEGDLVLRAIRDLYDRDIDEIQVEGNAAYKQARDVIKMLMPDHVNKVIEHDKRTPLFISNGIEPQLDNIFSPVVNLPSGGYLVINQTEALVAIDVNSGKATRERNIEATALKTNLEAAAEACRQMRLRDLAGLIVIDFIDMEETKHNRAVEKKMKECLSIDRARVQTGRISQFGLFEISRQRRRAGVLELSSEPCKACSGTGRTRSIESAALQLLRAIEERAADKRVEKVSAEAPADVALYILNNKREAITLMEETTGVDVVIETNDHLMPGDFEIEATSRGKVIPYQPITPPASTKRRRRHREVEEEEDTSSTGLDVIDEDDGEEDEGSADSSDKEQSENNSKRRRRGRRGGRRRRSGSDAPENAEVETEETSKEGSGGRSKRSRKRRVRRRTPDVAMDGGEMIDAIASAPFLFEEADQSDEMDSPVDDDSVEPVAAPADDKVDTANETDTVDGSGSVEEKSGSDTDGSEEPVPSAAAQTQSEEQEPATEPEPTTESVETTAEPVVEIEPPVEEAPVEPEPVAETEADVAAEEAVEDISEPVPAEADEAEPAGATLHSLHTSAPTLEEAAPPKKRRIGWWNKK